MATQLRQVSVPDLGGFEAVEVVELLVAPGDTVAAEDPLITLLSDKASMDVPAPFAGTVRELHVQVGSQVSTGDRIATLEAADVEAEPEPPQPPPEPAPEPEPVPAAPAPPPPRREPDDVARPVHAGPAVRRFARELGVDLSRVSGSGRRGRITRSDVEAWVKRALTERPAGGGALPEMPVIDFSRFGEVEQVPLNPIRRVAARNLHRSWLHVPHVTQHVEADITELEAFRREQRALLERSGGPALTFLPFIMKASVAALQRFPDANSSLAPSGDALIHKRYYHLGIAVDTPDGLVVPVIRDVDRKGAVALAEELADVSSRARNRKLRPDDFQGATFSISNLGGIGHGTGFTPVVNAPEVAILGVSRAQRKPQWRDDQFVPRLMLPLSLSYDHRVIDGVAGLRFVQFIADALADLRRLLL